MIQLEPNTFVEVQGLKCPECGEQVQVAISEWETETGKPLGFQVECVNDEDDDLYDGGDECDQCGGSALDYDHGAEEGPSACEHCGGSGEATTGHRYFQSDWQPVIDQAEAWAKKRFRVPEASR